jgi:hypothetical protein
MDNDNYSATLIGGVKILESQHVDLNTVDGYDVPVDATDFSATPASSSSTRQLGRPSAGLFVCCRSERVSGGGLNRLVTAALICRGHLMLTHCACVGFLL